MEIKQVQEKYESLAKLLIKGEVLLDDLNKAYGKEHVKKKTMDKLAFAKGLKSKADKIIRKTTELTARRNTNKYNLFIEEASKFIDTTVKVKKSPSFQLNFKKEGRAQYFANDFNIRMASLDIDHYIKDVRRIKNALFLELKKLERTLEQEKIREKFDEIRKSIERI